MAAYAALVSLVHLIDQIQNHPRPPISLDKMKVESLIEKATFLQEFLEGYSNVGYNKEADALESRIADAAYAAEDVIESHIVDQILVESTSHGEKINSIGFYEGLHKVIEDMDSIKKEAMRYKEKKGVRDQMPRSSMPAGSLRSSSTVQKNTMVGFDDVLLKVMDKLIGGGLNRQIIPIVGMGGIGKTTLARNIYQNQVIVQYFHILIWVTISQEYKMREILLQLLQEGGRDFSQIDEYELGDKLHKKLSGQRYLIIMDDIWDIEVWDQLKFFFPDNCNGSRIVLTTRLSNLASRVANSCCIDMAFLDEHNSWNLFSKTLFGDEDCPLELVKIGKKIVKNCRGLPLSIVVIGGLLAKSKLTREYWEYIEGKLSPVVNSEDNERCLKILHMSYNQLPVYLKPCFLYIGVFSEDNVIHVSTLVKLWVAEGFLKPISGKSLEVVAKEYLQELINRNLILVHELGSTGSMRYCNMHDLVRDLCLREAQKERFYNVLGQHSLNIVPQGIDNKRCIVIPESTLEEKVLDALQSMSLARSLICNIMRVLPSVNFRLLRIFKTFDRYARYRDGYFLENIFQLVNSRYLAVKAQWDSKFAFSVYLWNLNTLIVDNYMGGRIIAPAEIWNLPQLRHVKFTAGLYLPDPPVSGYVGGQYDMVLGNLQTLLHVCDFKCGEEMVKRIPNIKKLGINYTSVDETSCYCLNNLVRLCKLESFHFYFDDSGANILEDLTFPHSLKKLTFWVFRAQYYWEDILEKIGSLPLLEKLKLHHGSFKGRKWETVEGQFPNLKFLLIDCCRNLERWTMESSHFTRLEHLVLKNLRELKEIPLDIGEIPTLQSIQLSYCSESVVISAKKVQEEQEELLGEVALQVRVNVWRKNKALERLASPNFQVHFMSSEF